MDKLFAYGILQIPKVLTAIITRLPRSSPATLMGYRSLKVVGANYPGLVEAAGSVVNGMLYSGLSKEELALLDSFEGRMYRRAKVRVSMNDGQVDEIAWVYLVRAEFFSKLTDEDWTLSGSEAGQ